MTHLCIDFGTSSTVAVLAGPQGVRPVLFDGAPSLISGVCADPSGRLLVGPDAAHAARTSPESYEPYPKQRIDERSVLLGGVEVATPDLFAAVLRRVLDQLPAAPQRVTITHPAAWGGQRREVLRESATRAGMTSVRLVSEPVAAAAYFAATAGATIPVGGSAVVCDLGAGTYDASVVRRTVDGFEVLATSGLSDGGGLDLDAAIVAHLGAVYAPKDPVAWARLTSPVEAADRRASRALWADVRTGKEMLSRASATHIHLPLLEAEAPLGREQFEALARPVIDRTVATTRLVVREAGVEVSALKGVFLVGGASRVPLVASMLHRALGVAPIVVEQPELAVAHGAVTAEDVSGPDFESTVRVTREQVAALRAVSAPPAGPSGRPPQTPVPRPAPAAVADTRPYSRFEVPTARKRKAVGAAAVPTDLPPKKRRWPAALVTVLVLAAVGSAGVAVYQNLDLLGSGDRNGAPTDGAPTDAAPTDRAPTDGGLLNIAGEPLDERVVEAVRQANPEDPDAYLALPGTDYTAGTPVPMVIDSASTSGGHLKLRVREAEASGASGEGLGPLWLAPADDAEVYTINGGRYDLVDFAAGLGSQTDGQKSQVYAITFSPNLAILKIQQQ